MYVSELEIASYIIRTSLFHLNRYHEWGRLRSMSLCFLMLQSMQYDHVLFRGVFSPLFCPGY